MNLSLENCKDTTHVHSHIYTLNVELQMQFASCGDDSFFLPLIRLMIFNSLQCEREEEEGEKSVNPKMQSIRIEMHNRKIQKEFLFPKIEHKF